MRVERGGWRVRVERGGRRVEGEGGDTYTETPPPVPS